MYDLLKDKGWHAIWVLTIITTIIFAFTVDYSTSSNELNGAFVGVILASFTSSTSLIAFFVVVTANDSKWGEVKEFKTYFAIGCLIATVSSCLQLASSFQ
ncbi:hypothetical protein NBRC116591_41410 [Sessilibacter corallicola]|uniref:Uncharacterized protein n=1 Tax=Sessilibacter corallicola TaxID=2904075 RepID=A0ABQ0AFA3_9GAMM